MSYQRRLCEILTYRYEQESARTEQAGSLRVFYFGLLGGMVGLIATILKDHGLRFSGEVADVCFWIFTALSATGCGFGENHGSRTTQGRAPAQI